MLNYIPDGYTEEGYVEARPGEHTEFRFSYRPALPEKRWELLADDKPGNERRFLEAAFAQLVSWDLVDASGAPVPLTLENFVRLKPRLLTAVRDIAVAFRLSDIDPRWPDTLKEEFQAAIDCAKAEEAKRKADARAEVQLAMSAAQHREDAHAKN